MRWGEALVVVRAETGYMWAALMARRRQVLLGLFLFVWGGYALIAQSILVRETMVLFFGGELSWGLVLFAWLAGITVGAALGARLVHFLPRAERMLAAAAMAQAVLVPLAIFVLRSCRTYLQVGPGEYISIVATGGLAIGLVGPCGIMIGLAFPLAVAVLRELPGSGARQIGWVYLIESAGSLAGGAIFTFWLVERFDPFSCCLVLGGASVLPLAFVVRPDGASAATKWSAAVVASALVVGGAGGAGRVLQTASIERRWNGFAPGLELVTSRDSRYQNLALGRLAGQFSLYTNGLRLTDFPQYWGDYRLATHIALSEHLEPRRVLLLGGGADGVLAEILRHRCVRQVDTVELDPVLLQTIRPHLPQRDREALADPRVRIHHADARQFVKQAEPGYDVILAVLPSPASAQVARFYTRQFYRELRQIMAPDGVYVFQADASPAELHPESLRYVASLVATLRNVFEDVLVAWGLSPQIFACPRRGILTVDLDLLVRRFLEQGTVLPDLEENLPAGADRRDLYRGFFAGCDWLDPRHVADRRRQIESLSDAAVYTDMRPAAYLDWLIWWDKQQRGPSAQLFERLQRVRAWQVLLAAAGAAALWQGLRLVSSRRRDLLGQAVALSIATTGLATMALEIVLLFAFQSFYGYVYQRIGLIIAVFMFGLFAGSGWMNRLLRARPGGSLYQMVLLDVLLAGLAGGIPAALAWLGQLPRGWAAPTVVEGAVFGLVAVAGLLGGLAFPLAAALYLRADAGSARAAGDLDAADHGGACLGALGTGLLLVPVLGIGPACGVLAVLKLGSAGWLALAGRLQARV